MKGMTGLTEGAGVAMIIAAFVISQVLRAGTGVSYKRLTLVKHDLSIFAPIVAGMAGASPVLVGLAICAGGIGLSLPNDSGFWVVSRFSKFDVKETMKVWTVGGTLSGITALIIVIILSLFSSSLPGLM